MRANDIIDQRHRRPHRSNRSRRRHLADAMAHRRHEQPADQRRRTALPRHEHLDPLAHRRRPRLDVQHLGDLPHLAAPRRPSPTRREGDTRPALEADQANHNRPADRRRHRTTRPRLPHLLRVRCRTGRRLRAPNRDQRPGHTRADRRRRRVLRPSRHRHHDRTQPRPLPARRRPHRGSRPQPVHRTGALLLDPGPRTRPRHRPRVPPGPRPVRPLRLRRLRSRRTRRRTRCSVLVLPDPDSPQRHATTTPPTSPTGSECCGSTRGYCSPSARRRSTPSIGSTSGRRRRRRDQQTQRWPKDTDREQPSPQSRHHDHSRPPVGDESRGSMHLARGVPHTTQPTRLGRPRRARRRRELSSGIRRNGVECSRRTECRHG